MFKVIKAYKIKRVLTVICLVLVLFAARGIFNKKSIMTFSDGNTKGYLAIIIDDFGYSGDGTEEMLNLKIPFTAAIMPFSAHTQEDLESVKQAGKDYIIHMPMESLTGKKEWVGDKGVFINMSDEEIAQRVNEAYSIVEGASGINNHMGSAIMEDERCLSAVLDVVKSKDGVFIDSVTTAGTLGKDICSQKEIVVLKRDVFLDSTDDINVVAQNLNKAADIALKNGTAVAIGHVGPEGGKITAKAIEQAYPEIMAKGVKFVTVSQMRELLENDY